MGGLQSKEQSPNPFGENGWTPERLGSLEGKTYLITGTTAGCGFEATRVLLKTGASVVMLNRSAERAQAAMDKFKEEFGSDAKVSNILADLADLASVRKAAASILQQVPKIDALICNAAIAQIAIQKLTVDGFESQIAVNYYSHFLLCGLLFDRIAESSGRVVVVGSNGYKMGPKEINLDDMNFDKNYTDWDAYCHSKLAQMIFAYELQRRVRACGKSVVVQMCHPGASQTELIRSETASMTKLVLARTLGRFFQSAEQGSWPEVMCATEQNLKDAAYYGPTQYMDTMGPIGECVVEPLALDEEMAKKLWTVSEEKVGLKWSP